MENEQHEIRDFFENFRDFFQFRGFIKISAIFTVFRDLSAISGDFRDSAEAAVDPGPWYQNDRIRCKIEKGNVLNRSDQSTKILRW